jgi:4'-phosphopantetheinyl transferase
MSIAPALNQFAMSHITGQLLVEPLDGIHVWVLPQQNSTSPEGARRYDAWWNLLSTEELERASRFHFAHHASDFVANRARLRILLGAYLEQSPSELAFTYSEAGKPRLSSGYGEIAFNLSHTDGFALVAVTRQGRVGVDIEKMNAANDSLDLARRYFSAHESQELYAYPNPAEQQAAFYRCWTRKEAFLKALGDGLSRPLSAFSVSCGRESAALLACDWEPNAQETWQLFPLEFDTGYAAALACEGNSLRLPDSPKLFYWSDLL